MKILEVKIVKSGTDEVVIHEAFFDVGAVCTARADLSDIIEQVTGCPLDQDDKFDLESLTLESQVASRFGADWEFYVEAIFIDADELDIDTDYDSFEDKYTMCL